MKFSIGIFLGACFLCMTVSAGGTTAGATILRPGDTLAVDLERPINPGGWIGLFENQNAWKLQNASVTTQPFPDDEEIRISSKPSGAIALFKVTSLVAGTVVTAKTPQEQTLSLEGGHDVDIEIENKKYKLRFSESDKQLILSNERAQTKLDTVSKGEIDRIVLTWAGDLDRDGGLDLILDITDNKSERFCLFLSSAAKHNELVHNVACQLFSG